MKKVVFTAALLVVAGVAMAEPACTVPKEKWMPEVAFKKSVAVHGYAIKTFKVNKGQCCELYGKRDGQNVEHWFNPETGARVTK